MGSPASENVGFGACLGAAGAVAIDEVRQHDLRLPAFLDPHLHKVDAGSLGRLGRLVGREADETANPWAHEGPGLIPRLLLAFRDDDEVGRHGVDHVRIPSIFGADGGDEHRETGADGNHAGGQSLAGQVPQQKADTGACEGCDNGCQKYPDHGSARSLSSGIRRHWTRRRSAWS
jgi:hypothetical protein